MEGKGPEDGRGTGDRNDPSRADEADRYPATSRYSTHVRSTLAHP